MWEKVEIWMDKITTQEGCLPVNRTGIIQLGVEFYLIVTAEFAITAANCASCRAHILR